MYLSTRDGSLGSFSIKAAGGFNLPIPRTQLCYGEDPTDAVLHGGLTIPATTPPGTYTIDASRGPELTVQVVAAPVRRVATVNSFAAFTNAVRAGFLDVTLAPGRYDWPAPVVLPANFVLRGDGAVIRRLPVTNLGTNWPCFVLGGNDVSVYGVRFVYDNCPGGMVFFANPSVSGLVLADAVLVRCNLGFYATGVLVRDCHFDGAGSIIAPSGLWLRDTFTGPPTIDPWQFWGPGSVQMIDCRFDGTSRGPVFNAAWGPIEGCLFVGTRCSGICGAPNAGEIFLVEGGAFNNNVILHTRVHGCESAVLQWDQGGSGNLVSDLAVDGGGGVLWWATAGDTTNNTLTSFELRRCGIYLSARATNNTFSNGTVIGFVPSRWNQSWRNPSPLGDARRIAIWAEGPNAATNTLQNVGVIGTPAGMTDQQGFTIRP